MLCLKQYFILNLFQSADNDFTNIIIKCFTLQLQMFNWRFPLYTSLNCTSL